MAFEGKDRFICQVALSTKDGLLKLTLLFFEKKDIPPIERLTLNSEEPYLKVIITPDYTEVVVNERARNMLFSLTWAEVYRWMENCNVPPLDLGEFQNGAGQARFTDDVRVQYVAVDSYKKVAAGRPPGPNTGMIDDDDIPF